MRKLAFAVLFVFSAASYAQVEEIPTTTAGNQDWTSRNVTYVSGNDDGCLFYHHTDARQRDDAFFTRTGCGQMAIDLQSVPRGWSEVESWSEKFSRSTFHVRSLSGSCTIRKQSDVTVEVFFEVSCDQLNDDLLQIF